MENIDIPFPPHDLMRLSVSWADDKRFEERGIESFDKVINAFELAGEKPTKESKILEWGCGCGRMSRQAIKQKYQLYGTDINSDAINWDKENLIGGNFSHCNIEPPLSYEDEYFDFIFAGSVITHISIKNQFEWMREMSRILKPSGMILLTFAGAFHFRNYFGRDNVNVSSLNSNPFLEVGIGTETSNSFGIAQTIGTLDDILFDFSRKIHFQCDDILGAQDTTVYQKNKNINKTQDVISENHIIFFRGREFVPRNTYVKIEDPLFYFSVDGGMPQQLYLQIVSNNSIQEPSNKYQNFNKYFDLLGVVGI